MTVRAEGRVSGAVDLRLLPAALATVATCLAVQALPYAMAVLLPWVLAGAAVVCTALLVRWNRTEWPSMVMALSACALWIAAVAGVQAVGHRAPVNSSGWEDAVATDQPVRLSGETTGSSTRSAGAFGPSWHLPVTVERFGHPLGSVPGGASVIVSGGRHWSDLDAGTPLCFVATLEAQNDSVFARAKTAPDTGSCPSSTDGTAGSSGSTGRDLVRTAVREAATGSVGDAPQLLPGLVLGDRSAQEPNLDEAMKTSGLSHLSAVSGANCTLIAGAVTMTLRSFRIRRPVVLATVLGVLVIFVIVVGAEPSVIRAAVMGALGAWAVFFGRGRHAVPLLFLAVCVLLCWEPALVTEPAFQLSVAATCGIVLAARPVEQWLTAALRHWMPGPVAGTIGAALAVTVCAQIACQPILVGMTGDLSAYSVPANLLAAPLVPFVTVPGTAAAVVAVPFPGLAAVVFWVIGWPAAGIGWIATVVSRWPGAVQPWPEGTTGVVLVFLHLTAAVALLWLVLRWERTRPARVRRLGQSNTGRTTSNPRLRWSVTVAWTVICAAAGSQLGVVLAPPAGPVPEDWSLAACDVGQGDMVALRTGDRSAMVVDTGPEPADARACLDRLGVDRVDLLVLSHLHADHTGGAAAVVDCCRPADILYSTASEGTETRVPALNGARQPASGETGRVGGQQVGGKQERDRPAPGWWVNWTVLDADHSAASENDASMQMLATVHTPQGEYSVLLTGDLEEDAARSLLQQGVYPDSVDVLKVAHHGASNGGADVIRAVDPALSVVGVGEDNTYGHPHPAIIGELERHGPVVRTDLHGTTVLSLRKGELVPTMAGSRR
ncbi:ComEC/Rec2 family competence protein [Citricoccus sp. GCM10030269]|uniref:ComEC/Rec2 family competence protein n=1 Tax=Citricoccus sp. GCM10030269 TaxID=3273388 RepID=UPI0036110918